MIHNNKISDLSKIFTTMENSQHDFYLTEDRFFELSDCNSDYCFFVQEDETIRVFLKKIGLFKANYQNQTIIEVYRHLTLSINIQIVKDSKAKQKIQQTMLASMEKSNFIKIVSRFNKPEKTVFWDFVSIFYNSLKEQEKQVQIDQHFIKNTKKQNLNQEEKALDELCEHIKQSGLSECCLTYRNDEECRECVAFGQKTEEEEEEKDGKIFTMITKALGELCEYIRQSELHECYLTYKGLEKECRDCVAFKIPHPYDKIHNNPLY